jgi:phosphoglycolate phosphatase
MSAPLRLVIFDVDGTLVDSQGDILAAMKATFAAIDQPLPDRETLLGVVGLSLEVLMPQLAPDRSAGTHKKMIQAYKDAYMDLRAQAGVAQSSPLYPGALEALRALHAQPETLLGVATGKSRRGLDKLIDGHGLEGLFVTQQVADHHPSKPHPAMILQALSETGVEADNAVMIGDTSFDMQMAAAAGVRGVAVSWGYHPVARLGDATHRIDSFAALEPALNAMWSTQP